jgi:hypothetical protein
MVEYDHLIKVEKVEDDHKVEEIFNKNSHFVTPGYCEGIVKSLPESTVV